LLIEIEAKVDPVIDDIIQCRLYADRFLTAGTVRIRLIEPAVALHVITDCKVETYAHIRLVRVSFHKWKFERHVHPMLAIAASEGYGAASNFA
jgi:hypothetical protein